jgi:tight adherence protein C
MVAVGVMARHLARRPLRARLRRLGQASAEVATPTAAQRLTAATRRTPASPSEPWQARVQAWTAPLARLSLPDGNWSDSPLRVRFLHAGLRHRQAPLQFFAVKSLLTFALPLGVLAVAALSGLATRPLVLAGAVVVAAAIGYALPNLYLSQRISQQQQEIFEHFPDAIDLMTVCVEAGLGLDAALARVGDEMGMVSPQLAEELHLVNLELRAGASREQALRNLALRTGVEDVELLVAMLVQADRFGTSVAQALRVHSDGLRTKRRQQAEERAAKIPVKLLFPMIFCIFPSMLLVLLGPAMLSIYRVLLPTMAGEPPQP